MFTGIVEEIGKVRQISLKEDILKLDIQAQKVCDRLRVGDSIATNGVCLTTVEMKKDILSFEVMKSTYDRTNLKYLKKGDPVNLERALRADARFGGHFVTGHIDGVRKILGFRKSGPGFIHIGLEQGDRDYIIKKGSISIDGVSLTISEISARHLRVDLIPHTLSATTLGMAKIGKSVNVEFDMLVKSARKGKEVKSGAVGKNLLEDAGFI